MGYYKNNNGTLEPIATNTRIEEVPIEDLVTQEELDEAVFHRLLQVTEMPDAQEWYEAHKPPVQYLGANENGLRHGHIYMASVTYDASGEPTEYFWDEVPITSAYRVDYEDTFFDEVLDVEEGLYTRVHTAYWANAVPEPNDKLVGIVFCFFGESDPPYLRGHLYSCRAVAGTDPVEYAWVDLTPSSLSTLTDTTISSPQSGDVLVYDGEKWENAEINGIISETGYKDVSAPIEHVYVRNNTGSLISDNSSNTMTFSVAEGEKYRITGTYRYQTALYGLYEDGAATRGTTYPNDGQSYSNAMTETKEIVIPSGVSVLRACSYQEAILVEKWSDNGYSVDYSSNVLYNKKWCACGDSFTSGDFSGYVDPEEHTGTDSDAYDPVRQMWKTYPWWISERNNMEIQLLAQAGNDFTNVEGAVRPFSNPNTEKYNYTQVATDCDYITLMFGLNETTLTTEQIGTRTDTTNETLWGAYNIVLEALITANPFAKIGIIISDAWITQEYHDALVAIAQYWGIPYLDLRNGVEVPMMIGGRLSAHSAKAETLRNDAFRVSANNGHPNLKAHEYRSTVIENFLRTL